MTLVVELAFIKDANASGKSHFSLTSSDSALSVTVPDAYTANQFGCNGGNSSPPLQWTGVPAGTRSFLVTLFDRDEHSTPSGWWRWIIYDLPFTVTQLPVGAGSAHSHLLPVGALQGRSDLGENAYHSLCPAKGDLPHRYVFTIYSLNVAKLNVPPNSSGAMVRLVAQDYVLGKAVFVVHFGR